MTPVQNVRKRPISENPAHSNNNQEEDEENDNNIIVAHEVGPEDNTFENMYIDKESTVSTTTNQPKIVSFDKVKQVVEQNKQLQNSQGTNEGKEGKEEKESKNNSVNSQAGMLCRIHKNRTMYYSWSANVTRWVIRMACCSDAFHQVLSSLPLDNVEIPDLRFTDCKYYII